MPRCKVCKVKFEPRYFLQKACIKPSCLAEWSKRDREAKQKKSDKVRKEALKTPSDHIKEAQKAINLFVRVRDINKPCVSCGNDREHEMGLKGHRYDAGHYRSIGSASHLRFNLYNINKQCVQCNREKSGNPIPYRIELIKRIGLTRVELLEYDNKPRRFTVDYLKRIKKLFSKRALWYEKRL